MMVRILALLVCNILLNGAIRMAYAQHSSGSIEYLGIPIKAVVYGNSHGITMGDPAAGNERFYIPYYSTSGSSLVGYDHSAGKAIDIPLGSSGGYGTALGADGALYVGGVNPGNMYRHDPKTGELENLGGWQYGNTYIWACAASPDGKKIYGACYPTSGVLEYDLDTAKLTWLGRMSTSETYARAIEVDTHGRIWIGIGMTRSLIVLDPKTGEKQELLPPDVGGRVVYDLKRNGNYICASVIYTDDLLVYDSKTLQIADRIPLPEGDAYWMNTTGGDDDIFYLYALPSNSVYRYERPTRTLTRLIQDFGQACEVIDDRWLHGINDQDYVKYDLAEGREVVRREIGQANDGMAIMCLASDSKGTIYGPTYINMHLFGYNPQTGKSRDLGKINRWGGQGDSISRGRDGKIYIGAYILATVNVYDPAKPWRYGEDEDANPRCYGPVGEGQYRTRCIELGPDGMIYVGSIPSYNSAPVGAFSRTNPETGEKKVWTDLVPGGAVDALASDDRYVFGAGGGKFFAFDTETQKKIFETDSTASALAATPEGHIVISTTEAEIALFDPDQMAFVERLAAPTGSLTHLTLAPNGKTYGINANSIVEIDPEHWQIRQIAPEGGSFLAADANSNLYFARREKLYRFRVAVRRLKVAAEHTRRRAIRRLRPARIRPVQELSPACSYRPARRRKTDRVR